METLVVILMGPPGAGKGTHAGPLSKQLGLPHISTGDLFRENIRNQTSLGLKAKEFIDLGNLVPDELVLSMLLERVSRDDCAQGYILDGFPRNLAQAKILNVKIGKERVLALNFNVPDQVLIERVTGRIACKKCGCPYHKIYHPPVKESVCDSCGGMLYQRVDDNEEIVRKRLEIYREQTMPLIQYYAEQGVLHEIHADQSKDEVFAEVLGAVLTCSPSNQ
jgi:adenylate kinase